MSTLKAEYRLNSMQVIQVRHGDLTQEDTDAIVNAANSHLAHGGGVAGAIVHRGGRVIQEESHRWVREHGPVPTGHVAVTSASNLSCRYIIHAVGPLWQGGGHREEEFLYSAVWKSFMKAHELDLTSIALPAMSSGIFGFPKDRCAAILVKAALDFCEQHPESSLGEIRLTNIDNLTGKVLEAELHKLSGE